MRKGLTEEQAQAAIGPLDEADLPPRTIAALRLADAMTVGGQPEIDEALREELLQHFSEGELLELGYALAVASGWQRMIEAFGIRPDFWSEATPLPF